MIGREEWLDACLGSIGPQLRFASAGLKVSGNGTAPLSREIAGRHHASFVSRNQRVSAEEHAKLIIREAHAETHYLWLIADDDLMAPGALARVLQMIGRARQRHAPLSAVIGRASYFSTTDDADLGEPVPDEGQWVVGRHTSLDRLGASTGGRAAIGAFIFQPKLVTVTDLERYDGTSHGLFGGFWDGLSKLQVPNVEVVSEALVHLRAAEKEWDESRIRTLLGRRQYEKLLPLDISRHIVTSNRRLTRSNSLKFAATVLPEERDALAEYVETFASFESGSRAISKTPKLVARVLFPFLTKLKACSDFLYVRIRRWRGF